MLNFVIFAPQSIATRECPASCKMIYAGTLNIRLINKNTTLQVFNKKCRMKHFGV